MFATLHANPNTFIKIAVGFASVLVAILTGIQTFLRYAERAEKHRLAGVRYGSIKREIEQKLAFAPKNSEELLPYIDALRIRWDQLNEECPTIPKRIWDRVSTQIKEARTSVPPNKSFEPTAT
jgi:hypothetical protein